MSTSWGKTNHENTLRNIRVCLTCSAGGHFEQIKQLKEVENAFNCFYVLPDNEATRQFQAKNPEKKVHLSVFLKHGISYVPRMAISAIQHFWFYVTERPQVVITTGASSVIPICLISKFFGSKLIYIESFARIHELNKTGELLYRFSDLFVVQWKELLEKYPKAVYGGWIY